MQETPGAPPDARDTRDKGRRDEDRRDEDTRDRQLGESAPGLSVEELAETADVPVRTIRYYISEGLLPGPGSRGKQATYGEEQLARLRLIRRLAERRVPLAQMRKLLAPLHLEDVRALLAEEDRRAAALERAERTASPKDYVAGLLQQARAMREAPPERPSAPGQRGQSVPPAKSGQSMSPGQSGPAPYGAPWAARGAESSALAPPTSEPSKEAQRRRFSGGPWRSSSPELPPNASAQRPAEAWQRWELAPGVELQVRADAARKHQRLIRRVLAAAQEAAQEGSQEASQEASQEEV